MSNKIMDYDEMAYEYRRDSMTTKKDILFDVKMKLNHLEKGSGLDTTHSMAFYTRSKELLLKFKKEVEDAILFEELEDMWSYDIDIDDTGITLRLIHADEVEFNDDGVVTFISMDEHFDLITVKAKMLTVEKYAEMYGVTVGAVRQWIRRGKLRSAIKNGGEWRIPELAEVSGRGYKFGTYHWQDELSDIPEEYKFINECTIASITQDEHKKDLFHIECWTVENAERTNIHRTEMETKEKEKFELMLISNPLVKAPTEYKNIYAISE